MVRLQIEVHAIEIAVQFPDTPDYGEALQFRDSVVDFRWGERAGNIDDGMFFPFSIVLCEYPSGTGDRGVGL